MTRVKLPYYVIRKGRGYFEIGKVRAELTGLPTSEPLGTDGPEAWTRAQACYEAFKDARNPNNRSRLGGYPAGSLGAAYVLWKRTVDWTDKSARTREEYNRAWDDHIDGQFGRWIRTRRWMRSIRPSPSHAPGRSRKPVWRGVACWLRKWAGVGNTRRGVSEPCLNSPRQNAIRP